MGLNLSGSNSCPRKHTMQYRHVKIFTGKTNNRQTKDKQVDRTKTDRDKDRRRRGEERGRNERGKQQGREGGSREEGRKAEIERSMERQTEERIQRKTGTGT